MRERDMRLRVERFIQTRLRSMLMPATLGLGMALGACDGEGLSANDGGEPPVLQDSAASTDTGSGTPQPDAGVATKYMAPVYSALVPDAELPLPTPDYMAPVKEDAGVAVRYMAQMPDADRDPGTVVALYLAQIP